MNKVQDDKGNENWVNLFPHPYEQFKWGVKVGHAATLPSRELCRYWERVIPTYYLPNYFETINYIDKPKENRDYLTIGWGGSLSHVQSFRDSGILNAIRNIVNIYDNVKFLICGDRRVFDKRIEIPEDKKLFQEFVPNEQWGSILSAKFDIGIAPLIGDYDKYRSWLKPIEYMLTKIPWIASVGPAYQELGE